GVRAAQLGSRRGILVFLLLTMVLGGAFLGIKFYEYHQKFEEQLVPGPNFHWEGPGAPHASIFFIFYFVMTGMHAVHMVIGIGMIAVLMVMTLRGKFSLEYHSPVELGGLYWHFVDIVWVFLFPLLYLV